MAATPRLGLEVMRDTAATPQMVRSQGTVGTAACQLEMAAAEATQQPVAAAVEMVESEAMGMETTPTADKVAPEVMEATQRLPEFPEPAMEATAEWVVTRRREENPVTAESAAWGAMLGILQAAETAGPADGEARVLRTRREPVARARPAETVETPEKATEGAEAVTGASAAPEETA